MACLNDGTPTHINYRRELVTYSAPDTSISHVSLLDKLSWEVIEPTTAPGEIWNTIWNLDGRRKPCNNEALEVDNVYYVNDIDKAEQFAKTYRGFAKLAVRKEDRVAHTRNRLRLMMGRGESRDESEQPLTIEELGSARADVPRTKSSNWYSGPPTSFTQPTPSTPPEPL